MTTLAMRLTAHAIGTLFLLGAGGAAAAQPVLADTPERTPAGATRDRTDQGGSGRRSNTTPSWRRRRDKITRGVLPDGKRLVSAENLLERRRPNVPVGEDAFYGMGLETDAAWSVTVVHHGGGMAGRFDFGEWNSGSPRGRTTTARSPSPPSIPRSSGSSSSRASMAASAR